MFLNTLDSSYTIPPPNPLIQRSMFPIEPPKTGLKIPFIKLKPFKGNDEMLYNYNK